MNVIVVGNGSSLLEKENGKLIDEFDIVVRFNNYTIKNFEKNVGTKTDYWFNTVNYNDTNQFRLKHNYKKVVWHCWNWNIEKDHGYKSLLKVFNNIDFSKTKIETIREIQQYAQDNEYFNYSTGVIAIWMLLKDFDKVTITGFDWWTKKSKHHYNDNGSIGDIHKPDKEYLVIQKLMKEGKVNFL